MVILLPAWWLCGCLLLPSTVQAQCPGKVLNQADSYRRTSTDHS
uniref:Uncharacterized protein n=1 Tax=Anguilla anguilla TaxID=7936 RepID=A0A0E9TYH6_ANGAN